MVRAGFVSYFWFLVFRNFLFCFFFFLIACFFLFLLTGLFFFFFLILCDGICMSLFTVNGLFSLLFDGGRYWTPILTLILTFYPQPLLHFCFFFSFWWVLSMHAVFLIGPFRGCLVYPPITLITTPLSQKNEKGLSAMCIVISVFLTHGMAGTLNPKP